MQATANIEKHSEKRHVGGRGHSPPISCKPALGSSNTAKWREEREKEREKESERQGEGGSEERRERRRGRESSEWRVRYIGASVESDGVSVLFFTFVFVLTFSLRLASLSFSARVRSHRGHL